jgi:hypothetical protein
MAKKKEQSLKERIDALFSALGTANKPSPEKIRTELFSIGESVEALENAQALADNDTRIADLESELGNLNVTLKELNGELEAFWRVSLAILTSR